MKIKKKIVIPIVLVVAVVGGLAAYQTKAVMAAKTAATDVDTAQATITEIKNTVSVTGTVESDNSHNVYTTLSYPVKELAVEVGDLVVEGDLICRLDTSALESTIAQNAATVSAAQEKAKFELAVAEKDRKTGEFNLEKDYNTQILAAEAQITQAENALSSAQHSASVARKELRDARDDKKDSDGEMYDSYDELVTKKQQANVQAEIGLEGAQKALEDAQANLRAIKMQAQESQIVADDAVKRAELSTNFSDQYIMIEKLRKDLADATIKAPISGTVTAIYVKEGATSTASGGLIAVIEDTEDLKVTTKVKEYDIGSVAQEQPVLIKTDSTGDDEFTGVVAKVAPTTTKSATGETVDNSNAEFVTEIKVNSGSALRIGMNARLEIITQQKQNVLTIPIDALTTDENGGDIVFIMQKQEDGTFIAKKIPVTVGMETDFTCEITNSELKDGDTVILTPGALMDGQLVADRNKPAAQAEDEDVQPQDGEVRAEGV